MQSQKRARERRKDGQQNSGAYTPPTGRSGIKIHRPSYSCKTCRARRVKCDQVHPQCSTCIKTGRECEWPDNKDTVSPRSTESNATSVSPESQRNEVNSTVRSRSGTSLGGPSGNVTSRTDAVLSAGVSPGPGASVSTDVKRNLGGHLSIQPGGRSRYLGPSFWGSAGRELPGLEKFLQDQDASTPDLSTVPDSVKYFRSLSSSNGQQPLKLPSEVQNLSDELQELSKAPTLAHMLREVPPKDVCRVLCQSFVQSIHPIIILIHLPSFYLQYDRFWTSYESQLYGGLPDGFLAECPSFLAMLFAILFSGSVTLPRAQGEGPITDSQLASLTKKLYKSTSRTLSLLGFPRNPTTYSLTAFLMWQNPLIREEDSLVSTSFISTAVRVAQAMGLHRDPSCFGLDPVQSELRRRLWWHIIHMDAMASTSSGLPPLMMDNNLYNTRMISEMKDIDVAPAQDSDGARKLTITGEASQHLEQPGSPYTRIFSVDPSGLNDSQRDTRHVVAVGRYLVTSTIRRIVRRQTEFWPWILDEVKAFEEQVEELDREVSDRVNRICPDSSPSLGAEADEIFIDNEAIQRDRNINSWSLDNVQQNQAFRHWAKKLLTLMVHKTYCILYQPLLREHPNDLWQKFRQDALRHVHSFVEIFIQMCTEPPFKPYYWLYPGTYQPLQASAILLADLIQWPESPEAPSSRVLVDKIFSLLSPDGGVVPEENGRLAQRNLSTTGIEAWIFLRNLRKHAWEKVGRDPKVIWVNARRDRDSQHEAGATEPVDSNISDLTNTFANTSYDRIPTSNFGPVLTGPQTTMAAEVSGPNTIDGLSNEGMNEFDWDQWDSMLGRSFDFQGQASPF